MLLVEGARLVGKTRLVERALASSSRESVKVDLELDVRFRMDMDECAAPPISLIDSLDATARTPLGGVLENQAAIEGA